MTDRPSGGSEEFVQFVNAYSHSWVCERGLESFRSSIPQVRQQAIEAYNYHASQGTHAIWEQIHGMVFALLCQD